MPAPILCFKADDSGLADICTARRKHIVVIHGKAAIAKRFIGRTDNAAQLAPWDHRLILHTEKRHLFMYFFWLLVRFICHDRFCLRKIRNTERSCRFQSAMNHTCESSECQCPSCHAAAKLDKMIRINAAQFHIITVIPHNQFHLPGIPQCGNLSSVQCPPDYN